MKISEPFAGIAAAITLLAPAVDAVNFGATNTLSVYWGQNSYGQGSGPLTQQSLATYCSNVVIDVIQMAFVTQVTTGQGPGPVINFANAGNNCSVFAGTNLLDCANIGNDIKTCQQQYKKTILLSIGGASYNEGGFTSKPAAEANATLLWNMFGPQNPSSNALRPFHDAVVDGFDLDPEDSNSYFRAFGLKLRALMSTDTSKPYYLTTSPQCKYPDTAIDPMLNDPRGGVPFDAVYVQYYNNPECDLRSFQSGSSTQSSFNFKTWNDWAVNSSANKNVKIFLGVPAATGAGAGYMTAAQLKPIINYCAGFSHFGGVMAWDASQAYSNKPFLGDTKTNLNNLGKSRKRSNWRKVLKMLEA